MPKPYSSDIRQRVAKYLSKKSKHRNIAKRLDISLSSVKRYAKIYKKDKSIKPLERKVSGRKITDLEALETFVKNNNHLSLSDMANKWKNISPEGLRKAIKNKLGYSFKKSLGFTKKGGKKHEDCF
jgi:transposase